MSSKNTPRSKKVVICGRSNRTVPTEEVREEGYELWYLGTETRDGGDKYYELHDISCRHEGAIRKLPDEVYRQGLPINNSVTALMVYAWLEGYTDIIVKGNAMVAQVEYLEQRPAVAYVVGWLNGKGIHVEWTDGPKNINYGRKTK